MTLRKEEGTSSTCPCSETLAMAVMRTEEEIKSVFPICKLGLSLLKIERGRGPKTGQGSKLKDGLMDRNTERGEEREKKGSC